VSVAFFVRRFIGDAVRDCDAWHNGLSETDRLGQEWRTVV
jgi:hypothetical protein